MIDFHKDSKRAAMSAERAGEADRERRPATEEPEGDESCRRISPSAPENHVISFFIFLVAIGIVLVLLFLVYYMVAVFVGAPFLPMHASSVATMLAYAGIKPRERFVDLGSGDGRLVIAAARCGAVAVGYEMNPFLVVFARMRIRIAGLQKHATIRWQSLWDADLRHVDVVSVFGITGMMPRLEKKLVDELRPGARVVSYVFSLPTWKPLRHEQGVRVYKKE